MENKQVLIANLGNRNLKFDGFMYSEIRDNLELKNEFHFKYNLVVESFLKFTEKIWLNMYNSIIIPSLDLNIIDKLLDNSDFNFTEVYLISSNQINERHQEQDTKFEAYILKYLVNQLYHLECHIFECNCNVVDNNALLKYYRNVLRELAENQNSTCFVICDAGGTAQQKMALKLASEYILDANSFEIYYPSVDGNLLACEQFEYRKIILAEQIQKLISVGNYLAALQLLPENYDDVQFKDLEKLLQFGKLRLDFLFNEICHLGKSSFKIIEIPEFIKDYKRRVPKCSNEFANIFDKQEHAFFVSELFYIAQFYLNNKNYTEFVISLAIFIESCCTQFITSNTDYKIINGNEYRKNGEKLLIENPGYAEKCRIELNYEKNIEMLTLPVCLSICSYIAEDRNANTAIALFSNLKKMNSCYSGIIVPIDVLRNNIAHRGEGIIYNDIKRLIESEHLANLSHLISASQYCPYLELNNYICNYMKIQL